MTLRQATKIDNLAQALIKSCDPTTVANVIDALLTCDQDESLTDAEAEAGNRLFDALTDIGGDHQIELERLRR